MGQGHDAGIGDRPDFLGTEPEAGERLLDALFAGLGFLGIRPFGDCLHQRGRFRLQMRPIPLLLRSLLLPHQVGLRRRRLLGLLEVLLVLVLLAQVFNRIAVEQRRVRLGRRTGLQLLGEVLQGLGELGALLSGCAALGLGCLAHGSRFLETLLCRFSLLQAIGQFGALEGALLFLAVDLELQRVRRLFVFGLRFRWCVVCRLGTVRVRGVAVLWRAVGWGVVFAVAVARHLGKPGCQGIVKAGLGRGRQWRRAGLCGGGCCLIAHRSNSCPSWVT